MNKLEQIHSMIRIVADSDDLEQDDISYNLSLRCSVVDVAVRAKRVSRRNMNQDAMATERLAEGIRLFSRDREKFESRPVA
jgi:transaldolase